MALYEMLFESACRFLAVVIIFLYRFAKVQYILKSMRCGEFEVNDGLRKDVHTIKAAASAFWVENV